MSVIAVSLKEFLCFNKKYLVYNLLLRNMRLKYRRSIFGYFWTLLIPSLQILIFYFVYSIVLKVSIPNYLAYMVSGLLPWIFFSTSILEGTESLLGGQGLLTNAPIPIQVFPAAATLTNFLNFLFSLPILFILVFASTPESFDWSDLLFFPLTIILVVLTYSLNVLLGCLFVFLRDLRHLIGLGMQLWMYVTPVLYDASMIPPSLRWALWINPISGYFMAIRELFFTNNVPRLEPILGLILWTLFFLVAANLVRSRWGTRLIEKL